MDEGHEAGPDLHPGPQPASRKTLRERLRARPDSEHEQALFRMGVGGMACLFALFWSNSSFLSPKGLFGLIFLFLAGSFLIFLDTVRHPKSNPYRRVAGIFLDTGCTTFFLSFSRGQGFPLVVLYLWVIVGNGFRYGQRYLFFSSFLSAIGLTIVFYDNPLWSKEPWLYESFLLSIIILPLYMASLIRKLYSAIEAANAASRAKSQFLATVSHELRTPLAGVLGIAELLWKSSPTHEQRSLLQSLSASAGSLKGLIENILEISRTEAGKSVMEEQPFNLFRLLQESTRTIVPLTFEKKLLFSFRLSGALPEIVIGDERRLQQVLVNLLGNAVKFTERGEVRLWVTGRGTTGRSGWLRFVVEDTGIGIPEEIRPRVFERFVQGDPGVTRKYGGTGLGTSIAKEMVEIMGGTIGFSSQSGSGTRFWFEIPYVAPEAGGETLPPPPPLQALLLDLLSEGEEPFPGIGPRARIDLTIVRDRRTAVEQVTGSFMKNRSFDALIVRIGQSMREWEEFVGLLRSFPLLDVLPVIFCETEPPLTLPALSDLWTLPRVYTILPADTSLLQSVLWTLPSRSNDKAFREESRTRPSLSVLVAEDNAVNRRVLQEMLREAGHTVALARDGEEALDLLEESPDGVFDAMILDYNMPGQGGLDVLKAWRFMDPRSRIATMILTAAVTPEVEETCRRTGVDAFLAKPADSRTLLDTLDRIVRGKGTKEPFPKGEDAEKTPILDLFIFEKLSRLGSSPSFMQDLIHSFRSDGYRLLFEMEEAVSDGDHATFLEKAHALKGGGLQVGAVALSEVCSRVARLTYPEMGTNRPRVLLSGISWAFREALEALERRIGIKTRVVETEPPG